MTDKRNMIGNEIRGGGRKQQPGLRRPNQVAVINYELLQRRRQQLIDLAANPPHIPAPPQVEAIIVKNPGFVQVAYSVLLIAILAIVAVGTAFINWAFLLYGLLAVAARLPSSQMFVAAIISLAFIPLTTALHRDTLANTFAVMTFYFLLIGLVRATLELRQENKQSNKVRKQRLRK